MEPQDPIQNHGDSTSVPDTDRAPARDVPTCGRCGFAIHTDEPVSQVGTWIVHQQASRCCALLKSEAYRLTGEFRRSLLLVVSAFEIAKEHGYTLNVARVHAAIEEVLRDLPKEAAATPDSGAPVTSNHQTLAEPSPK